GILAGLFSLAPQAAAEELREMVFVALPAFLMGTFFVGSDRRRAALAEVFCWTALVAALVGLAQAAGLDGWAEPDRASHTVDWSKFGFRGPLLRFAYETLSAWSRSSWAHPESWNWTWAGNYAQSFQDVAAVAAPWNWF